MYFFLINKRLILYLILYKKIKVYIYTDLWLFDLLFVNFPQKKALIFVNINNYYQTIIYLINILIK